MEILIKYLFILVVFGGCFASSLGGDEAALLHDLFSNYETLERAGKGHPLKVQHQYDLIRIDEFDVQRQVLTLVVFDFLQWRDERLVWDKGSYSVDKIGVPASYIWMPDIEIYNRAAPAEENVQNPLAIINSTGHIAYIPFRRIKTYCDVDDHIAAGDLVTCKITIGSWVHDAGDIDFELSGDEEHEIALHDFSDANRNWAVETTKVEREAKQYACCPETYVTLNYYINLKRKNHMSCP